jgi:hypothetical protein
MNQTQYTTLFEALAVIPDPRKARGQRCDCPVVASACRHLAGGGPNPHIPAQLTLLRTARQIDVDILETAIAQLTQPQTDAEEAARARPDRYGGYKAMDVSMYARWRAPPAIVQPWVGLWCGPTASRHLAP